MASIILPQLDNHISQILHTSLLYELNMHFTMHVTLSNENSVIAVAEHCTVMKTNIFFLVSTNLSLLTRKQNLNDLCFKNENYLKIKKKKEEQKFEESKKLIV